MSRGVTVDEIHKLNNISFISYVFSQYICSITLSIYKYIPNNFNEEILKLKKNMNHINKNDFAKLIALLQQITF